MVKAIIFFLMCNIPNLALAEAKKPDFNANEYFRRQALKLPEAILDKCAELHVKTRQEMNELVTGIKTVQWRLIEKGEKLILDSGMMRAGFVYLKEYNAVLVNEQVITELIENPLRRGNLPALALHESFRALGIEDEDYQSTGAIVQILKTCQNDFLLELKPQINLDIKMPKKGFVNIQGAEIRMDGDSTKSSGGVTSTGGGGNDFAIFFKTILLAATWPEMQDQWLALQRLIPQLQMITKKQFAQAVLSAKIESRVLGKVTKSAKIIFFNGQKIFWIPECNFQEISKEEQAKILVELIRLILVNR